MGFNIPTDVSNNSAAGPSDQVGSAEAESAGTTSATAGSEIGRGVGRGRGAGKTRGAGRSRGAVRSNISVIERGAGRGSAVGGRGSGSAAAGRGRGSAARRGRGSAAAVHEGATAVHGAAVEFDGQGSSWRSGRRVGRIYLTRRRSHVAFGSGRGPTLEDDN